MKYDILLACSYHPGEENTDRFSYFDNIGETVTSAGRTIYLPHKELAGVPDEEHHGKLLEAMYGSDLVLCDIGVGSYSVGSMIHGTGSSCTPIVYLFDDPSNLEDSEFQFARCSGAAEPAEPIDMSKGFSNLESFLKQAFSE